MNNLPKISGFNPTSEAGVNIFVPSIFVNCCNLKCPYCMNSTLAKSKCQEDIDIEDIKKYIIDEKKDQIIISGGEPLLQHNIKNLIDEFVNISCKVGISTNGVFYRKLKEVLPSLSYVALDIKTSDWNKYAQIDKLELSFTLGLVLRSKSLLVKEKLIRDNFDYEIRTTLYPEFVNEETIEEIGGLIRPSEKWVLQQYRVTENMYNKEAKLVTPYTDEEVNNLLQIAKNYSQNVSLRNV